jgi:hypothetical protein
MGSLRRRIFAAMMAIAILIVGAPLLPANAAMDCGQMAMADSMAMDMKSAPTHQMPAKQGLPCNDGLSCLGGAGCAAPVIDLLSVVSLPGIATADANWVSRLGGPSIAYKPALPPPIA